MTIHHIDEDNTCDSEDYCEPDATTVLIDCLCGQRFNGLQLNGCTTAEHLVYRGKCDSATCRRAMTFTIEARARPDSEAKP